MPICILKETITEYETQLQTQSGLHPQLAGFSNEYLLDTMVDGQIVQRFETIRTGEDYVKLSGKYICHEMIGQIYSEEIIAPHE